MISLQNKLPLVFLLFFVHSNSAYPASFSSESDGLYKDFYSSTSEEAEEPCTLGFELNASDESLKTPITTSDRKRVIEVRKPTDETLNNILDRAYKSTKKFKGELKRYVVGIKGQDHLLTLDDAYEMKLLGSEDAGAILEHVASFRDGETSTLRLGFGIRSGEDIVIGRYPASLIARPYGSEVFQPGDPSLNPLIKWLSVLGHMTWVKPLNGGGLSASRTFNSGDFSHKLQLTAMAASIATNYLDKESEQRYSAGASLGVMGIGGSAGWSNSDSMGGAWFGVMSGWMGVGAHGIHNLEEQQLGLSGIGGSGKIAGWRNYVQMGASMSFIVANGDILNTGGTITLSKDRITNYKKRYSGEYDDIINRFTEEYKLRLKLLRSELLITKQLRSLIEIMDDGRGVESVDKDLDRIKSSCERITNKIKWHLSEKKFFHNKHLIEVIDTSSKGLWIDGGSYVSGFGQGVRIGVSKGHQNINRFYTSLERAQELLIDGKPNNISILRLPQKVDKKAFPDLRNPIKWNIGEEVVTTVERSFYGSIVMGIFAIPGIDAKAGISGTVKGTFEFGVRRLPGNKVEVSLKPTDIKEMGAFISTISSLGPQISAASTVALAMRQTLIFDLDNQDAVDAYSLMLTGGKLPLEFSRSANVIGDREAENLLDVAIIARKNLSKKGILLTYLEKIDVPAKKFYVGALKIPGIKAKHWAGLSYEYLSGQAKVISTNAEFALSRHTKFVDTSTALLTSGEYKTSASATIRRGFKKEDSDKALKEGSAEDGFTWRFYGVTLRGKLEDTKITGNEQNKMINVLNSMFHANVHPFPDSQEIVHKQSRQVLIERDLSGKDFDEFANVRQSTIDLAASGSGLKRSDLATFIATLEDKGHNQMATIIEKFVGKHGLKGFSAVHLLLEGTCRNLIIRTHSDSYSDPIKEANRLEALYTMPSSGEHSCLSSQIDLNYHSSEKSIKNIYKSFFKTIKNIDRALHDLDSDPLFEGKDDLLKFGDSGLREKKSVLRSRLFATKNKLLDLLDIEKQGFDKSSTINIYSKLKEKYQTVEHKVILLESRYPLKISIYDSRSNITRRWKVVKKVLHLIKEEIEEYSQPRLPLILGVNFIDNKNKKLLSLLERVKNIITLNHIKGNEARLFQEKMTKKKWGVFSAKPIHHEIAGTLGVVE